MSLLVIEFVCSGGQYLVDSAPFPSSLRREGRAMLSSLIHGLLAAGVDQGEYLLAQSENEVVPKSLGWKARTVANTSDFWQALDAAIGSPPTQTEVIVIAPETDGWLHRLALAVEKRGARLLSPDSTFIELCSDKSATCQQLQQHGIPVPASLQSEHQPQHDWIVKPRTACGSQDVRRVTGNSPDISKLDLQTWHVEPFVEGDPASVAALCGPRGLWLLPPCYQRIDQPSGFEYLGGERITQTTLRQTIWKLARQVFAALPTTTGFVGIDLIVRPNGPPVVLEVNPRLTSSWLGLSNWLAPSLAATMLDWARGHACSLHEHPGPNLFSLPDFSIDE